MTCRRRENWGAAFAPVALALTEPLVAIEWTEADELAAQPPVAAALSEETVRH